MTHVGQDLRLAARRLIHDRAFTVLATIALGLGIGVNSTFFTLVNAAVLRGLPIDASEDVMFIAMRDSRNVPVGLTRREYDELRGGTRVFAAVGAYTTAFMVVADAAAAPQRVNGTSLSASAVRILGVPPLTGRELRPDDDRPGAPPVAVIGERLWRTRYAGQASAMGRRITLNGQAATIVGVMPEGFRFPSNAEVWRPLASVDGPAAAREARVLSVFGRLAAPSTIEQARSELEAIRGAWAAREPSALDGLRASVVPIEEQLFGRVTDTVWLAFITAGVLVLLIACANVANLLLMRAAGRGREMAVRLSLGATRARIVGQLLTESSLLAVLGAAAGVGFSWLGLRLLQAQVPADVASLFDFTLDARVMAALIGASAGSILVFGLAPALHVARRSTAETLEASGRDGGTLARRRWATALLAAEFALTLVLLANVADAIRSGIAARDAQFPIDPAPLLTMSVTLPNQPYATAEARGSFFARLHETLAGVPSVAAVGAASALPGSGVPMRAVTLAGRPAPPAGSAPRAATVFIGARYFEAIGAPLRRGRPFDPDGGIVDPETAIVNERFVELFLPGDDPIDALIRVERDDASGPPGPWRRIVGVAPSVRQSSADGIDPDPVVYLPAASVAPSTMVVFVRTTGDPAAAAPPIREAVRRLDASLPLDRMMPLDDALRQAQWNGRISRVLLDAIGTIALLLALVGLYAVTAHSVRLRRRELGIRMALGAARSHVAALVLRRALLQLAVGVAAGVGATLAFDRFFTGAVELMDPAVILPTIAAMVLVGAAACLWPAAAAARSDPAVILRDG